VCGIKGCTLPSGHEGYCCHAVACWQKQRRTNTRIASLESDLSAERAKVERLRELLGRSETHGALYYLRQARTLYNDNPQHQEITGLLIAITNALELREEGK
jgi:hypothetical protein